MVEQKPDSAALAAAFKALGDETRLRIVAFLGSEGALRVTAVASRFELSLNAVSKHIKQLEAAGIVARYVSGREHFIALRPEATHEIEAWLELVEGDWHRRLARLHAVLGPPSDRSSSDRPEAE